MKSQQVPLDEENQKRKEESRRQKEETRKQKIEAYREAAERQQRQRQAAEETAARLGKKKSEWYMNPYYLTFGALTLLLLYVIIMLFLNKQPPLNKVPVLDDKRIHEHNDNFPWKQGVSSFWEGATLADAKKLFTTNFASHSNIPKCIVDTSLILPDSFDTRKEWESCKMDVMNQERKCSSAFASVLASATSERLCISSQDKVLVPLSAQELISCDTTNHGCRGGYLNNALDYIRVKGLVEDKCFPYKASSEVKCDEMCKDGKREKIDSFCVLFGEEDIKREIMKNGPVVGVMQVYSDFLTYKNGVYVKGDDIPRFSGYHTVKVIGWGIDSEGEANKYWIVENTWGSDWGENGYARIAIGNEFFFEQYVYGIKTHNEVLAAQEAMKNKKEKEKEKTKIDDIPDTKLDDDDEKK